VVTQRFYYGHNDDVSDTSHLTPHTSHLTPHTSHLTPHTSHLTPHTSHLTPRRSPASPATRLLTSLPAVRWEKTPKSCCGLRPTCTPSLKSAGGATIHVLQPQTPFNPRFAVTTRRAWRRCSGRHAAGSCVPSAATCTTRSSSTSSPFFPSRPLPHHPLISNDSQLRPTLARMQRLCRVARGRPQRSERRSSRVGTSTSSCGR
jgi:hypothetical protein